MRSYIVAGASAVMALAGGCTFILDIQKEYTVADDDAGASTTTEGGAGAGTGAAGGATATSSASGTSTTSTTSTSSDGSGATACPAGMLDLDAFCIDATEVTNAAYAAWLATQPSPATQPAACAFNTSFAPKDDWPAPASLAGRPVAHVNWCDAHAYCAAAGKRLCGRIGGGALAFDAFDDAEQSQWMAACSNGGASDYPYGDTYDPAACNGEDAPSSQTVAVGSEAACHGAGSGAALFDMSGNVAEWEDACDGDGGANDDCRRRGGSFKDAAPDLRCAVDAGAARRSWTGSGTGFRCCSP